MSKIKIQLAFLLLLGVITIPAIAKKYLTKEQFIQQAFASIENGNEPTMKTLWLDDKVQAKITKILEHSYPKLRLRYWKYDDQTVWFLDEIGKERPISFGVSVKSQRINLIKVLEFRESRGGEIHMQAFTDQFEQIKLTDEYKLDKHIDGITGATMSVDAMKKIARVALMLDELVQ
ncbi:FMN-binding protein [Kangiella sediminilitoris]|uniref:FMN-binding domain protein n=1 Tax=Kangiella sediminilitoris TaxID=1144748 RepID=A0A1B3B9I7_9GAMM|nr:FMN-binding protein [Kangiella sediminilitoris]AOE49459.1 FMN-binding domain protein [Kangiella sediminilitoris]